jgi:thymidylate synthase ThyX
MQPKVTLLSAPLFPLETAYVLWHASRNNDPIKTPRQIWEACRTDKALYKDVANTFIKMVNEDIPIIESLQFVFLLEGVSISFREQMVRHRVGMKFGERLGVDFIPDLNDSSWWSQSMRVLDMGNFYDDGAFRVPEGLSDSENDAVWFAGRAYTPQAAYQRAMQLSQEAYQVLLESGLPPEEAREVIPLSATHRISWSLNLKAIKHIIGKRSCWILQGGLWEPIIQGIMNELCENIHPIFQVLSQPPCIKNNQYQSCPFVTSNVERFEGKDPNPPCALWLYNESKEPWYADSPGMADRFYEMTERYSRLWGISIDVASEPAASIDPEPAGSQETPTKNNLNN